MHLSQLADFLIRLEAQLSLRKKNQSSTPTRAKTIRTATKKKRTITMLLGNGTKKEAR